MSQLDNLQQRFLYFQKTFKGSTDHSITWFDKILSQYFRQSSINHYSEITRQSVEIWIMNGKIKLAWSPKTVLNKIQALSSFCNWLLREGLIESNPINDIPRPKQDKKIPKSLSKEQAELLLEWAIHYPYPSDFARTRSVAIMATFIYAGLRKSELIDLKYRHVDFDRNSIFVEFGKGMKDRIVPINSILIDYLQEYKIERTKLGRTCPYFFTSSRSDNHIGRDVVKRLFIKLRESSGIYCYPHLLRHTFATLMLEGGCDLFSLSKFMGHSDMRTTAIYLSVSDKHLRGQIENHSLRAIPFP